MRAGWILAVAVCCGSVEADTRELAFFHTHTGESLTIVYRRDGAYLADALNRIEEFLKDFRDGARHPIDPALLDVLYELKTVTGSAAPFEVISAYRSPGTNEMLRRKTGGVASQSLHLHGQAIDIRLRDVDLTQLKEAAVELKAGGVGFYPESDFVHVDTGRVRYW